MADFVLADTSVVSRLTKQSPDSLAYFRWLGSKRLAVNFQVQAELLGAGFGGQRKQRLDDLLAACTKLPMNESTHIWYARVLNVRTELRKAHHEGGDCGDADMWVISSALEYGVPLFSHDRKQVQLARFMNGDCLTNLNELRDANPAT